MSKRGGIQGFIEDRAEGPAFAAVAVGMVLRAVQFYSGGTIILSKFLGPVGMEWFGALTGLSTAVGAELLMSVAGRQWLHNKAEAREAQARRGVTKGEREAMIAHFNDKAKRALAFMCFGLVASLVAAFSFLFTTNGDHSPGAIIAECMVSGVLVAVAFYFGVMKESAPKADPSEIATEQAYAIRATVTAEAGKRIAGGTYSMQDVRIVKASLPAAEQGKFVEALARDTGEPVWGTSDIARFLGSDDANTRRAIIRKLNRLLQAGTEGVTKDDKRGYQVARSVVFAEFGDELAALLAKSDTGTHRAVRRATRPRQTDSAGTENQVAGQDHDATATRQGQAEDAAGVGDEGASPVGVVVGQVAPAMVG